jgi:hypothetical protein
MTDDTPSPALLFITACCQLVDPGVTAGAILSAKKRAPAALHEQDVAADRALSEADREALRAWDRSELAQKLREPDL